MVTWRPDRSGLPAGASGAGPAPGGPPSALIRAARRPAQGGSTLVLNADGQNVVVVLGEHGGDAAMMWAFIRRHLAGGKTVRM